MYFVYAGSERERKWISKLDGLLSYYAIAAFQTREIAVAYALKQEFATVVVERKLSVANGDENNLISELEFDTYVEPPSSGGGGGSESPPSTGTPSILWGNVTVEYDPAEGTIYANTDNLQHSELDDRLIYQWMHRAAGAVEFEPIPGFVTDFFYMSRMDPPYDLGAYQVVVTRAGALGVYFSNIYEIPGTPTYVDTSEEVSGSLSINGLFQAGKVIYADLANFPTISGEDPAKNRLIYQWFKAPDNISRPEPIPGAVSESLVLDDPDVGYWFQVVATRSNSKGMLVSDIVGPIT